MRAAVLYDVDDIRIEERAIPEIGSGELLVRTGASGICTGDIMAWYVRRKAPLVLGHEPAGTVEEVGSGVTDFEPGDRVFAHHHAPCFECAACERGDYVQCPAWRTSAIHPGGLSQYFRVPAGNTADTLKLPASVSLADGSLVEPLACVVKSLRRSGVGAGDSLLVIGLGVMGLMHALAAADLGVRVIGTDLLEPRRANASRLGIDVRVPDQVAGEASVVVCGPGTSDALRSAVEAVQPGGTVVMFTPLGPDNGFTFHPDDLYFRDVRLIPSYSCGPPETRAALELIERGVVTAERLGATYYALDDVPAAYAALQRAEIVKPIVTF